MPVEIQRLSDLEPNDLALLIADSEAHGLRFVRRLAEEWAGGVNRFDRPGEALFVARNDERVVGVGGLNIDPYVAEPRVGRVRHLYVLSACRRLGIGRRLVAEIIEAARDRFESLRLSTSNPEAARLYERLGFQPLVGVAHCTHTMDMNPHRERTAHLQAIAPQFLVDDLDAAIAYYRDRLGFAVDFVYESFYAGVSRGGALIHLKCAPKTASDRAHRREHEHLDAYVAVAGVEALYQELQSRGARITKPLGARPWGHTDFYVEDADGYILCFSEEKA
jgi:ribosomal protein S18 acetylase RimI-like enzyme/uncharacterized glyoxalase superfamily protein PhnB